MHQIRDSKENYLEGIYVLQEETGHVRSVDLARHLNLSRASVSNAVKKMEEEGYVIMEKDGELRLTEQGAAIGQMIDERHKTLKDLLMYVGVDEDLAEYDACRMEHAISKETFQILKDYLDKHVPEVLENVE
ncbi:metal-dependent transcriptional regulator [Kallipyga gabonensis]|uniref:metal-dependent transcriptional regulator n=1 Tax=Kallipyga gabonensis TaxID=1686287 RepID=UPI0006B45008|nr:metal-dependent transcriptional regulator [Kallipyga gabonensis]